MTDTRAAGIEARLRARLADRQRMNIDCRIGSAHDGETLVLERESDYLDALERILDIHQNHDGWCSNCLDSMACGIDWPCVTVEEVMFALGVKP